MSKKYKVCQSCATPMKSEREKGTEKDGSKSIRYCEHCYQFGEFTNEFKDAKQMQDFVINHMVNEMKFPRFMAKMFARKIPKLERWNK